MKGTPEQSTRGDMEAPLTDFIDQANPELKNLSDLSEHTSQIANHLVEYIRYSIRHDIANDYSSLIVNYSLNGKGGEIMIGNDIYSLDQMKVNLDQRRLELVVRAVNSHEFERDVIKLGIPTTGVSSFIDYASSVTKFVEVPQNKRYSYLHQFKTEDGNQIFSTLNINLMHYSKRPEQFALFYEGIKRITQLILIAEATYAKAEYEG